MGLLERLDEVDYRLHLRPRPGTARPRALSPGRIRLLRALWCVALVWMVLALVVAVSRGLWSLPLIAVAPALQWCLYDRETRRRILGRYRRRRGTSSEAIGDDHG